MNIDQFTNGDSIEAAQLKEHIASGATSEWCVYVDTQIASGNAYRYSNYQDANNKFDSVGSDHYVDLVLYTRIGTSVVFRRKEPEKSE